MVLKYGFEWMNQKKNGFDAYFKIHERGSTFQQELIAGLTTYLAMLYSVIVVPNMLTLAGFPPTSTFIATCLLAALGSLLMGLWANLPMAIGSAVSLTAFTTFSIVLTQHIAVSVALGAVFWLGILLTLISVTGIRAWILRNLPQGVACGIGIGIGLFLILIAATSVGLIVKNSEQGLPMHLGTFISFPVLMTLLGLAMIFGLEKRKVPGAVLCVIVFISLLGLCLDPQVKYHGLFALPPLFNTQMNSLFLHLDILGALHLSVLPSVFALIITAVFDATGTIHAVASQANLLSAHQPIQMQNESKVLAADSISSIFASFIGASPAAVYIESAAGTAVGGKTGLTATVVGLLFLFTLFISPLAYLVPAYATAPALMYVGLLMLSNVSKLNFADLVDALSGLLCAVFIVLTCNIVTGIMLGLGALVIGRICAGEWRQLTLGTVVIALILILFYVSGRAV